MKWSHFRIASSEREREREREKQSQRLERSTMMYSILRGQPRFLWGGGGGERNNVDFGKENELG